MLERCYAFGRWLQSIQRGVLWAIAMFVVGFVISDCFLEQAIANLYQAKPSGDEAATDVPIEITEAGETWMGLGFGAFAALLTFWFRRISDEHSLNFIALSDAVNRFLLLIEDPERTRGGQQGTTESRLRLFIGEFTSRDYLLLNFSEVGIREQSRLYRLVKGAFQGPVDAGGYHDQIRIASILCAQGNRRFWATSTDPAMVFYRENALYYHALQEAAEKYHNSNRNHPGSDANNPPYLCRIFLCPPENLDYSLEL